jgi:hypothetical protein
VGETVRRFAVKGSDSPALCQLRERLAEWTELDAQRLELARRSVELPSGLLDSDDALAAISRGAQGKNLWAPITLGKGAAKALVNAIRLDGASVRDGDVEGWRHVAVYISNIRRLRQITGRWHSFIAAIGAPRSDNLREQVESARRALFSAETLKDHSALLASLTSNTVAVDRLIEDQSFCTALARQIRTGAGAARLSGIRQHIDRTVARFDLGSDPTSVLAKEFLTQAIGNPKFASGDAERTWKMLLQFIQAILALSDDFSTITSIAASVENAGAPEWAKRLRSEKPA